MGQVNIRRFEAKWIAVIALAAAGAASEASTIRLTLTRGTVIPATLTNNLSSDHNYVGDQFTVNIKGNYLGLPSGTTAKGVVRAAKVKTDETQGTLLIAFTSITLPNGRSYSIDGSAIGLDDKSVSTVNGKMVAKPGVKDQRLTYIGYGAGAGFALGLLSGSNRVAKSTVVGGAIGYLAGALSGGNKHKTNNVLLKGGTTVGIKIERPVTLRYQVN